MTAIELWIRRCIEVETQSSKRGQVLLSGKQLPVTRVKSCDTLGMSELFGPCMCNLLICVICIFAVRCCKSMSLHVSKQSEHPRNNQFLSLVTPWTVSPTQLTEPGVPQESRDPWSAKTDATCEIGNSKKQMAGWMGIMILQIPDYQLIVLIILILGSPIFKQTHRGSHQTGRYFSTILAHKPPSSQQPAPKQTTDTPTKNEAEHIGDLSLSLSNCCWGCQDTIRTL